MPWTYKQSTGEIFLDGELFATGYSGKGIGKNNPVMQYVKNVGPVPEGKYTLSDAFYHPHKGPVCIRLHPVKQEQMHGRSGFLIHGDSIKRPGEASEGCIIVNKTTRLAIDRSKDKLLIVEN
ncbi:MAG: DUF2778 domain-containing protein [Negativicutes bacterium]|nr:DUF2778 domain-containing protein [Negativicutes bacterium]